MKMVGGDTVIPIVARDRVTVLGADIIKIAKLEAGLQARQRKVRVR